MDGEVREMSMAKTVGLHEMTGESRPAALGFPMAGIAAWLALLFVPRPAFADYALNMTRGVTPISREVYDLHMLIFWICVAIGVVVFGVMFYSFFKFRKSKGAVAAQFSHNGRLEVLWTVIPVVILVGMAVPATRTLIAMEEVAGDADLSIKVTGYQWKWRYDYLDEGFGFFSVLAEDSNEARALRSGIAPQDVPNYLLEVDEPMVVPIDKKIRFLVTANDVLHSWWVPALGWKRDAIPGFVNASWAVIQEPGTYRGQCAELCGRDHAFMPVVLKAVTQDEYRSWADEMKARERAALEASDKTYTLAELMDRGQKVYQTNCLACHQQNGQGIPGAFPTLVGSAITVGPVAGHLDIVLNGKPGTAMAAFSNQLNDADLAAVVTYERNAWGNDARLAEGEPALIQPVDVKARRALAQAQ